MLRLQHIAGKAIEVLKGFHLGPLSSVLSIGLTLFGIMSLTTGAWLFLNKAPVIENQGEKVTNLQAILDDAEVAHADSVAGLETKSALDAPSVTTCYYGTIEHQLTENIYCGLVLHAGASIGQYDSVSVSFPVQADGKNLAVLGGASFIPNSEVPGNVELVRPDGVKPLNADSLTEAQPMATLSNDLMPEAGQGIMPIASVDTDALRSIIAEPVTVLTPNSSSLVTTGYAESVEVRGQDYAAPQGYQYIVVTVDRTVGVADAATLAQEAGTGAKQDSVSIGIDGTTENVTPTALGDPIIALVPSGSVITGEFIFDNATQTLALNGPDAGTISTDNPATTGLYDDPADAPVPSFTTGYMVTGSSTQEDGNAGGTIKAEATSARLINDYYPGTGFVDEGENIFVLTVEGVTGSCSLSTVSPTNARFFSTTASVNGVSLGEPSQANDINSSEISLFWRVPAGTKNVSVVLRPTVRCAGYVLGTGGTQSFDYMMTLPAAQAGSMDIAFETPSED